MNPQIASHIIESVVDTGIKTVAPTLLSHILNRSDAAAANDYNSPLHLMSLYRQAGISPSAAAQAISGSQGITANASAPAQNVNQGKSPLDVYILKKEIEQRQELNEANIKAAKAAAAEHQANADRIKATTLSDVSRAESLAKQAQEQYNLNQQQTRQLRLANDRFESLNESAKLQAAYEMIQAYYRAKSAKNEAQLSDLKNEFARKYHADPDAGWLPMLIQSVGSGDEAVPKALFQSLKIMLGESWNELNEATQEMFDKIFP